MCCREPPATHQISSSRALEHLSIFLPKTLYVFFVVVVSNCAYRKKGRKSEQYINELRLSAPKETKSKKGFNFLSLSIPCGCFFRPQKRHQTEKLSLLRQAARGAQQRKHDEGLSFGSEFRIESQTVTSTTPLRSLLVVESSCFALLHEHRGSLTVRRNSSLSFICTTDHFLFAPEAVI